MQRLDFKLHDFSRICWTSAQIETVWTDRMELIKAALKAVEIHSVLDGQRQAALVDVNSTAFPELFVQCAQAGFLAVPLEMDAVYDSKTQTPEISELKVLITEDDLVEPFKQAYLANDHQLLGKMLSYPNCCVAFYGRNPDYQSLIWPHALLNGEEQAERKMKINGTDQLNPMLRNIGIQMVSHWSCSGSCEASLARAEINAKMMHQLGYSKELSWLEKILSWPVEWSALHGIAEIRLPIAKIATNTDATPHLYTVSRAGTEVPEKAASGTRFPFQTLSKPKLTSRKLFTKGQLSPEQMIGEKLWQDNGFASAAGMKSEHELIFNGLNSRLATLQGGLFDVGCGNGYFLKKCVEKNSDIIPYGCDTEPDRVERAGLLQQKFQANFFQMNMFDPALKNTFESQGVHLALTLLMAGRLLSAEQSEKQLLFDFLQQHTDQIAVYCYEDWYLKHGEISKLATKAGFRVTEQLNNRLAMVAVV